MNVNDRYERRGMDRQADLNRKASVRPIISRGHHIEAKLDWGALNYTSRSLVDTVTGKFFFIVGVSTVGDPMFVVRP